MISSLLLKKRRRKSKGSAQRNISARISFSRSSLLAMRLMEWALEAGKENSSFLCAGRSSDWYECCSFWIGLMEGGQNWKAFLLMMMFSEGSVFFSS